MSRDHLTALQHADPAAGRTPDPDSAARLDAALEQILAETPTAVRVPAATGPGGPRRSAPTRWSGRATAAVAVAACGFGVVALLPGSGSDSGAPGVGVAPASAATVLSNARAELLDGGGSGAWAYQRAETFTTHMFSRPGGGTATAVVPSITETWVGPGDEQRMRTVQGDAVTFPTAADRAAWEAAPRPALPGDGKVLTRGDGAGLFGLTPDDVRALPTDPAALATRLEQAAAKVRGLAPLGLASQLLQTPLTPPAVKAALLSVLQRSAGAQLVRGVTDPEGRTGDAVVFHSEAWDTLLLFDHASGALLGTQSIGKHEVPGRKTEDWNLILQSDRRESAPAAELREEVKTEPDPIGKGTVQRVQLVPVS